MHKNKTTRKSLFINLLLLFLLTSFLCSPINVMATDFPQITLTFDPADQSVIVSGIPTYDSTGTIEYEVHGYLNYGSERVESFSYGPATYPYHVPENQAYIFNWADAEFLPPCSGEYTFTAWLVAIVPNGQGMDHEKGHR